jgi:hypothetical protein
MLPARSRELDQITQVLKQASVDKKKKELLASNKEAARALLSSLSTVSYVTIKKNESTE